MRQITIDPEELKDILKGIENWKAPGIDEVQNFWLKQFPSTHEYLTRTFTQLLSGGQHIPVWLTNGRTTLIPKTKETTNPKTIGQLHVYQALTNFLQVWYLEKSQNKEHLLTSNIVVASWKRLQKPYNHIDTFQEIVWYRAAWLDYRKIKDQQSRSTCDRDHPRNYENLEDWALHKKS